MARNFKDHFNGNYTRTLSLSACEIYNLFNMGSCSLKSEAEKVYKKNFGPGAQNGKICFLIL